MIFQPLDVPFFSTRCGTILSLVQRAIFSFISQPPYFFPLRDSIWNFLARIKTIHGNTRTRNGKVIKNNLSVAFAFFLLALVLVPIFQMLTTTAVQSGVRTQ